MQDWIEDARRNTRDDIVVVLVGNKRDRDDKCVCHFTALAVFCRCVVLCKAARGCDAGGLWASPRARTALPRTVVYLLRRLRARVRTWIRCVGAGRVLGRSRAGSIRRCSCVCQLFIDSGALVYEKLLSGHIDPNNDVRTPMTVPMCVLAPHVRSPCLVLSCQFHGVQIGDIKDPRYIRGGRAGGGRLASASTADSSTSRCSCCIVS